MKKLLFLLLPIYCFGQIDTTIIIPPSKDTTKIKLKAVTTATTTLSTAKSIVITSSGTVTPLPPDTGATVPGVVYFKGDWTKTMGGFTTSNLGPSNYTKDGTTWHGLQAAQFKLSGNDLTGGCPADCSDCNRNEVAELPGDQGGVNDEAKAIGTTVYFAGSYKIASSFQTSPRTWVIPLQLHGPSGYGTNPVFAFDIGSKKWKANIRSGNMSTGTSLKGWAFTGNGAINYGAWTDFIIAINFKRDNTGSITIYRRDEGQAKFATVLTVPNIPTYQFSGTSPIEYHYWKTGLYGKCSKTVTDQIWLGPFSRGSSFAAVEQSSFNTNNGF